MASKAPWATSYDGLAALRGRAHSRHQNRKPRRLNPDDDKAYPAFAKDVESWKAYFAEIDALLDRRDRVFAGETPLPKKPISSDSAKKKAPLGLKGALQAPARVHGQIQGAGMS